MLLLELLRTRNGGQSMLIVGKLQQLPTPPCRKDKISGFGTNRFYQMLQLIWYATVSSWSRSYQTHNRAAQPLLRL